MKCFVYRNLNRKGVVYSLKALDGPHKGKVIAYSDNFAVINARFVVSESGRKRAVKEQKRNVHAGVVGDVVCYKKVNRLPNDIPSILPEDFPILFCYGINPQPVYYNPFKSATFTAGPNGMPLHEARYVVFHEKKITAHSPNYSSSV